MNILFIEDEKELALLGAAQLELKGCTVFVASDLAEAQAILDDPERTVHYVITDHRLPDGMGIQFVIDIKNTFSMGKCAVVSGCLSPRDIEMLDAHNISYYHKPLLYGAVLDDLRRKHAANARAYVKPALSQEPESESIAGAECQQSSQVVATDKAIKRRGFRFWPFR